MAGNSENKLQLNNSLWPVELSKKISFTCYFIASCALKIAYLLHHKVEM